jgi:hypothetical protein
MFPMPDVSSYRDSTHPQTEVECGGSARTVVGASRDITVVANLSRSAYPHMHDVRPTQKPSTTSEPFVIARDSVASRSNRSIFRELPVMSPFESRLTRWGQSFSISLNGSAVRVS